MKVRYAKSLTLIFEPYCDECQVLVGIIRYELLFICCWILQLFSIFRKCYILMSCFVTKKKSIWTLKTYRLWSTYLLMGRKDLQSVSEFCKTSEASHILKSLQTKQFAIFSTSLSIANSKVAARDFNDILFFVLLVFCTCFQTIILISASKWLW